MAIIEPWLHRHHCEKMPLGTYYHVFSRLHPSGVAAETQAVSYNPNSKGRMAMTGGGTSMFYAGSTPLAALWETVLARAKVRPGIPTSSNPAPKHGVYVKSSKLTNMAMAEVKLIKAIDILDLRPPQRDMLVDTDSARDQDWSRILNTTQYDQTHAASGAVHTQLQALGKSLEGFCWPSRRIHCDSVYLLYAPPTHHSHWQVVSITELDTAAGEFFIDSVLRANNFEWMGDPASGGSIPKMAP